MQQESGRTCPAVVRGQVCATAIGARPFHAARAQPRRHAVIGRRRLVGRQPGTTPGLSRGRAGTPSGHAVRPMQRPSIMCSQACQVIREQGGKPHVAMQVCHQAHQQLARPVQLVELASADGTWHPSCSAPHVLHQVAQQRQAAQWLQQLSAAAQEGFTWWPIEQSS